MRQIVLFARFVWSAIQHTVHGQVRAQHENGAEDLPPIRYPGDVTKIHLA